MRVGGHLQIRCTVCGHESGVSAEVYIKSFGVACRRCGTKEELSHWSDVKIGEEIEWGDFDGSGEWAWRHFKIYAKFIREV